MPINKPKEWSQNLHWPLKDSLTHPLRLCYAAVCFLYNTIFLLMFFTCFLNSFSVLALTFLIPYSSPQKNNPHINHNTNTPPTIIPESLNIATLFPLAAILPSLPAEPLRLVLIDEKVSFYSSISIISRNFPCAIFRKFRLEQEIKAEIGINVRSCQ